MPDPKPPALRVDDIEVYRAGRRVLTGVTLAVPVGGVCAIRGPNGSGRSTVLDVIMGLVPGQPASGVITWEGARIDGLPSPQIVHRGIAYVPQEGGVFGDLTVDENLRVGGHRHTSRGQLKTVLESVLESLPFLAGRRTQRAETLSGGERRLLSLGRALMSTPRLILLDELTSGLAPRTVREVLAVLSRLRSAGLSILAVEHNRGSLGPVEAYELPDGGVG